MTTLDYATHRYHVLFMAIREVHSCREPSESLLTSPCGASAPFSLSCHVFPFLLYPSNLFLGWPLNSH